jgi:hypothetical protein
VAGPVCVKPGDRIRLLYRIKVHRPRKGERRSFAETDYAALLDAAHQYAAFRTLALSRLAAQHEEILRLRAAASAGNLRDLASARDRLRQHR